MLLRIVSAGVVLMGVVCLAAMAGDVTPPGGPVTGTMKTLTDIEPRVAIRNDPGLVPVVIAAAGSYYLAEDILGLPGQHGIQIAASDVTLDLNGFAIRGNLEVGSIDGVNLTAAASNVCVRNGVIRDFQGLGVSANTPNLGCLFASLRVSNCGSIGIRSGLGGLVSGCVVRDCGSIGITGQDGALITGCTSYSNAAAGINNGGGLVHGCSARDNVGLQIALVNGALGHDNSAP